MQNRQLIVYNISMSIWRRISESISGIGGSPLGLLSRMVSAPARDPLNSVAFTIGMIALSAKMAKVDGKVTGDEIAAFREVFQVEPAELHNVARVFNLAKRDVAGYQAYARQIARLFVERPQVLEDVLDGLFHIAKADGNVGADELDYLRAVAGIFGLSDRFQCITARHIRPARDNPYAVLGTDPCISDNELKRLYRAAVRENHPDRHIAAGVPEELISIATERLAAVNVAWRQISLERGF